MMIQCYECQAKYHLKCLNIATLEKDDEWMCFDCLKLDLSRPPKSNDNSKKRQSSTNPANDSMSKATDPKTKGDQSVAEPLGNLNNNQKSSGNDNRNVETQSKQDSHHSTRISQATRSSVRRRTQLELERLEEERLLKEKRDKEYLDNKYRILQEDCSNRSERSVNDSRITDRSMFTRDWIQNHSVEVQPPTPINECDEESWDDIEKRFYQKLDEVTFDKTSPLYQQVRSKSSTRQCSAGSKPISMPPEREQIQSSETMPKAPLKDGSFRERIPCPKHDARRFMFEDRGIPSGDGHAIVPCSNSTFAVPKSNDHASKESKVDENLKQISPVSESHLTLEWDNFLGTKGDQTSGHNDPRERIPNRSTINDDKSAKKSSIRNRESSEFKGHQPYIDLTRFNDAVNNGNNDEHIPSHHRSSNNQSQRRVEFKDPGDSNRDQSRFLSVEGRPKTKINRNASTYEYYSGSEGDIGHERETFDHRTTSNPTDRRAVFEEFGYTNRSHLNDLSIESQTGTSYAPTLRTVGHLTPEQVASRHVVEKKLPNFFGNPMEWPIWYNQYKNSTKMCGFSNGENLDRLQRCIKGDAYDAVKGRLIHPESVPWIIETLQMLYGRPEVIIKTIIDEIRKHPPLRPDRLEAIIDFAFEVQTICTTIESLDCDSHLTDPMLINELVEKLPTQEKKEWAKYKAGIRNVDLKTLSKWLYELAKLLSTVATPRVSKPNAKKAEKEKFDINEKAAGLEHVNVHVNRTNNDSDNRKRVQQEDKNLQRKFPCPVCQNDCNKLENCSKFKTLGVDARWKSINDHKLCRRCLRKHRSPCRATNICGKNGCQYKHHFLLHNDERHSPPKNHPNVNTTVVPSNIHAGSSSSTMLRIVPVILYNGTKSVATFAFFDEGTTVTMMEKQLAEELGLNGTAEQLCLIWTKNIHRSEKAERVSLEISGINGFNKRYALRGVRTVDDLHLPSQTVNKDELVARYPYLRSVPLVNYINGTPGIMIGSDMPKLGTQLQVIESENVENDKFNGPIASKSRLGWSVHGPRHGTSTKEYVNVHQFEMCPHHNEIDSDIHQRVKEYFSVENFGVRASNFSLESKENERAIAMLNQLTKKVNGRYETGLLWKDNDVTLPDSYPMAMKRLISLEKQGPEITKILAAKVAEYVEKGYARKVTESELQCKGWYLPLFGVVHPKKPLKLRMVFDAAAKVKSVSLNSVLIKGPDLYTSLIDILRRFRERLYSGGGDIVEMYHQVAIIEKDRPYQRFLFRSDGKSKPDVYQMEVMTFGANCSPSSAQFVKNKNANEFKSSHPRAVSAIIDNHYVDDLMDCEHTEREMIKLLKDVRMIHAHGGFKIRNFISNSENVLKALGESEISDGKDIVSKTELKIERVLGMWYDTKSDTFTFSLKYTLIDERIFNGSKLPTKREILRTLMSIFDPLGLLSNYLIYLKILLQDL